MTKKEQRLLILINVARAHTMSFDPPCTSADRVAHAIQALGVDVTTRQINDWYHKRKIPTRKFRDRDVDKILWALEEIISESPLGNTFPRKEDLNTG